MKMQKSVRNSHINSYKGYYRNFVNSNFCVFDNFRHRNSYKLVVFCGPSLTDRLINTTSSIVYRATLKSASISQFRVLRTKLSPTQNSQRMKEITLRNKHQATIQTTFRVFSVLRTTRPNILASTEHSRLLR